MRYMIALSLLLMLSVAANTNASPTCAQCGAEGDCSLGYEWGYDGGCTQTPVCYSQCHDPNNWFLFCSMQGSLQHCPVLPEAVAMSGQVIFADSTDSERGICPDIPVVVVGSVQEPAEQGSMRISIVM